MAETHRRVEARSIVGTGMSTDPERIREIELRKARMERDYNLPQKQFGEVMGKPAKTGAPKDTQWVDEPEPKEKRSARGVSDPKGKAAPEDNQDDPKEGRAKDEPPPQAPQGDPQEPPKPQRPTMTAAKAKVGTTVGVRGRVAFKV